MSGRGVTIAEVASRARVSKATAGRVLGGYGYASEPSRRRVMAAAETLGYRANGLARSLARGRTRTIGVVLGDIASPFHAAILRAVSDVAEQEGLAVLITNTDECTQREACAIATLMEKRVDGLVVTPADPSSASALAGAIEAGVPVVLVDRQLSGLEADFVGIDNVAAAAAATTRLIGAGHRRIAILAEHGDAEGREGDALSPSLQRLKGYRLAHEQAGIAVPSDLIAAAGGYSVEAGTRATLGLLAMRNGPTALLTADGAMSAGAMIAIAERGIRVPEDLSLLCFDDLDWMGFVQPGIDAVRQPLSEIGTWASRILVKRLNGEAGPPEIVRLEVEDVRRGSVAAAVH